MFFGEGRKQQMKEKKSLIPVDNLLYIKVFFKWFYHCLCVKLASLHQSVSVIVSVSVNQ